MLLKVLSSIQIMKSVLLTKIAGMVPLIGETDQLKPHYVDVVKENWILVNVMVVMAMSMSNSMVKLLTRQTVMYSARKSNLTSSVCETSRKMNSSLNSFRRYTTYFQKS